ncbi:MAG: efflux RND transporter periplasmic adaptor subunit [Peptococcaceae bacterium]|jgi:HlyD family secretion protein|nr:efflux RND transporter periplasmic adaptor subunit [Peptococcaceae bacterium]
MSEVAVSEKAITPGRRKRGRLILIVLIMASAIFGLWMIGQGFAGRGNYLEVQSTVEMTEIHIAAQMAGQMRFLYVVEGDRVTAGQLIGEIDSDVLWVQEAEAQGGVAAIEGQLHGAQANVAAAQAKLNQVQEGVRPEEVAQAKAAYDLAQNTFNRIQALYQNGAVSQVDYDAAATNCEVTRLKYEMGVRGARDSEADAARAGLSGALAAVEALTGQLQSAQSKLEEIRAYLAKAKILAPSAGVITQLSVEQGELVVAGSQIGVIADDTKPWIQCHVQETELEQVQVGQIVRLRFGAYAGKEYQGQVTSINKKADFAVKRATLDNGSFDVVAYGVKVEPMNMGSAALYPGMTVFVNLRPHE